MRRGVIWLAIPAGLVFAALVAWLLWPTELRSRPAPTPEGRHETVRSAQRESEAPAEGAASKAVDDHVAVPRRVAAEPVEEAAEDVHDHAIAEDPTGDLRLYEKYPMSEVPHRVVRGWGARGSGSVPGAVGVFVVVEPGISDADLEALARDVRDYHHDATTLSVRILDSQEAATYDRHSDGGAQAAEHLVAVVSRNENLESDTIEIRGRSLDPDER